MFYCSIDIVILSSNANRQTLIDKNFKLGLLPNDVSYVDMKIMHFSLNHFLFYSTFNLTIRSSLLHYMTLK